MSRPITERQAQQLRDGADVLAELRALQPAEPTTWNAALSIAEEQADRLLELLYVTEPPVPQFVVSGLPGIVVDRRHAWPTSGMSVHTGTHWQIVVRASEPPQRQRFTLAHEFKHLIDDPIIERLRDDLGGGERIEQLCDYFAACLLMPREWVVRDVLAGRRQASGMARRYYVSTRAMTRRLQALGVTKPRPLAASGERTAA